GEEYRIARRRDAGQRRELPDQETAFGRAAYTFNRKPGPNMTLRLGAQFGCLIRPRRGHGLPAGPGEQRFDSYYGIEHGGSAPGGISLADAGARAWGEDHPCRSAFFPHL